MSSQSCRDANQLALMFAPVNAMLRSNAHILQDQPVIERSTYLSDPLAVTHPCSQSCSLVLRIGCLESSYELTAHHPTELLRVIMCAHVQLLLFGLVFVLLL